MPNQRLPDEDGVGSLLTHPAGVVEAEDPGLGDLDPVVGDEGDEFPEPVEIHLEGLQVCVSTSAVMPSASVRSRKARSSTSLRAAAMSNTRSAP